MGSSASEGNSTGGERLRHSLAWLQHSTGAGADGFWIGRSFCQGSGEDERALRDSGSEFERSNGNAQACGNVRAAIIAAFAAGQGGGADW